jgi:hypothetical protein
MATLSGEWANTSSGTFYTTGYIVYPVVFVLDNFTGND